MSVLAGRNRGNVEKQVRLFLYASFLTGCRFCGHQIFGCINTLFGVDQFKQRQNLAALESALSAGSLTFFLIGKTFVSQEHKCNQGVVVNQLFYRACEQCLVSAKKPEK